MNGRSSNTSKRGSDQENGQILLDGLPASNREHCFLREYQQTANSYSAVLDDEGTAVGMLWIGPQQPADQPGAFWVFYVRIEEVFRGQGYGRAAMELAESEARSRGASELGLNVFGHNQVARRLYESMGYIATSIRMKKDL